MCEFVNPKNYDLKLGFPPFSLLAEVLSIYNIQKSVAGGTLLAMQLCMNM
jgi:hypothetical protein